MKTEQINNELSKEGLRIAASDEAGWYAFIWDDENDSTLVVWVTEI